MAGRANKAKKAPAKKPRKVPAPKPKKRTPRIVKKPLPVVNVQSPLPASTVAETKALPLPPAPVKEPTVKQAIKTVNELLDELPYRRKEFVLRYLHTNNMAESYALAYGEHLAPETCHAAASGLLKKVSIAAIVRKARHFLLDQYEVSLQRNVAEQRCIAYFDPADVLDFSGENFTWKPANQIPERARRAISSIETKRYTEGRGDHAREVEEIRFKFWNKNDALKELNKLTGQRPANKNTYAAFVSVQQNNTTQQVGGMSDDELANRYARFVQLLQADSPLYESGEASAMGTVPFAVVDGSERSLDPGRSAPFPEPHHGEGRNVAGPVATSGASPDA